MKTKKLSKKLVLNRETIVNIKGGIVETKPTDFTYNCYATNTCQLTCNPYYCYESWDTCESCLLIGTQCQAW